MDCNMKILAIIPAYNEAGNILNTIDDLAKDFPAIDILVVNDGSLDNTAELVKSTKAYLIDLPINLGIGGAVQSGFKFAVQNNYDIALQFDGDGQHIAKEICKILQPIYDQQADVVIGSRFLVKESSFKSSFMRRKGIWIFKVVNYLLIHQIVTDNTSGFRAYNKKAISFLAKNYPTDYPEPESVVMLGKNKFRIKEVSVDMRQRNFGSSSIRSYKIFIYMFKVLLSVIMTSLRKS